MKKARILLFVASVAAGALITGAAVRHAAMSALANAPRSQQSPQSASTIASIVDRDISAVEKQIIDVAEAMPEQKFNCSPESLNIPGSDYQGVRTFAVQVKDIAASKWYIWSPLTGDRLPEDLNDGNGPEGLRTKAGIIRFLKDSFALGHKAAATLTTDNMLQLLPGGKSTRLQRRIRSGPRLRSLRPDGRIPSHERNHTTREPGKVGLMVRREERLR